jgi:hypothetical protein
LVVSVGYFRSLGPFKVHGDFNRLFAHFDV